jgi:hypothetical protein
MAELLNIQYEQNADGVYIPLQSRTPDLQSPEVEERAFLAELTEINATWEVIKDEAEGRSFEIAVVNSDKLGDEVVLFPSTSFSSITHNAGNAIELAANGAANPDAARIYIAHAGSGGSTAMHYDEWAHVVRSGRLTYGQEPEDYAAMSYFDSMARALEKYIDKHNGVEPTKISADESGCRSALGLMAALDRNIIELVYLNNMPGISAKKYASAMLEEDLAGRRKQHGKQDYAYGEVTPESKKDARERLTAIYDTPRHDRLWWWTYARAVPGIPYMLSLGNRHADLDNPSSHAALNDLAAATLRQEASVSLQFNTKSGIHDIDDCIRFGGLAMDSIPGSMRSNERAVELLIGEGSLDEHTVHPAGRLAAEQYALELGPWRPRDPEPEDPDLGFEG